MCQTETSYSSCDLPIFVTMSDNTENEINTLNENSCYSSSDSNSEDLSPKNKNIVLNTDRYDVSNSAEDLDNLSLEEPNGLSDNLINKECDLNSSEANAVFTTSEEQVTDKANITSNVIENSIISEISSINIIENYEVKSEPETDYIFGDSCIVENVNKNDTSTKGKDCRISEDEKQKFQDLVTQCELKLEELGSENISLRNEVGQLKIQLSQQEAELKKQEAKAKVELLSNIEKLSRECNSLRKEKEASVIRYANSEKEVINYKKIQQDLEKKLKDFNKYKENLLLKLKNAATENTKLSASVENKMVEIATLQRENDKLNVDFNSREIRIKWLQNKLKTEVNAHQETQTKLEQTLHRLSEMREEAEQVRKDCQEMIKCYQEAEEIKSVKLDGQLKQKLSELEVQKAEKCDQEQIYVLLRQELDALKKKQRLTMEENNALTLKINSLEKERLDYEHTLCKLKDNQNLLKEEIADLSSQLSEMEGLKLQLESEKEKSAATLREVERLRQTNAELQSDLDACHVKEGDRLDFVEKLTAKTMLLQSDHCLLEVKAQSLEDEVNQLKKNLAEMEQKHIKLVEEYTKCKNGHENEMHLLVQKLAEKAKNAEKLSTKLEESENENRVLKRRHIVSIKELSRELYQCKKRLELHESNSGIRTESVSLGSKSSSSASLNISNSNDVIESSISPTVNFSGNKDTSSHQEKSCTDTEFKLDKDVLIDRIITLQKLLAKKTDKIDFLEDHIEHLVREMRKKSKSVDFKYV